MKFILLALLTFGAFAQTNKNLIEDKLTLRSKDRDGGFLYLEAHQLIDAATASLIEKIADNKNESFDNYISSLLDNDIHPTIIKGDIVRILSNVIRLPSEERFRENADSGTKEPLILDHDDEASTLIFLKPFFTTYTEVYTTNSHAQLKVIEESVRKRTIHELGHVYFGLNEAESKDFSEKFLRLLSSYQPEAKNLTSTIAWVVVSYQGSYTTKKDQFQDQLKNGQTLDNLILRNQNEFIQKFEKLLRNYEIKILSPILITDDLNAIQYKLDYSESQFKEHLEGKKD